MRIVKLTYMKLVSCVWFPSSNTAIIKYWNLSFHTHCKFLWEKRRRKVSECTIRSINVNGRNIGRNEHQKEPTNGISQCQNDQGPPKSHCQLADSENHFARASDSRMRKRSQLRASGQCSKPLTESAELWEENL